MSKRQRVEIAHMELAEPSIGTAVAKCALDGIKKVVIAPYFLSRGRHITSDIPALVAEAQRAHPEIECVIAEPIGITKRPLIFPIKSKESASHAAADLRLWFQTVGDLKCHGMQVSILSWRKLLRTG